MVSLESGKELRKPPSVVTSGDLGGSTSGTAPSVVSRASSSASGKRVLPHIPGGGNDVADAESVASNSVSPRSGSSDSDNGFFEVLSSEAPLSSRPAERKATLTKEHRHSEVGNSKKRLEDTTEEGQFEIIGDSPELRDTSEEPVDFQRHSTVRRSWNKICSSAMTSRGPSHDARNLFPGRNDVRGGTGNTSAGDGGGGGGGGQRTHNRVGKLRSLPRFDESSSLKEDTLEKSRKDAVYDTVEPSRVRPWSDDSGKSDGGGQKEDRTTPSVSSAKSSGWRSDIGRRLPDSPARSVFRTLSDYSTKQLRAKSVKTDRIHQPPPTPPPRPREAVANSQATTTKFNVRSSSIGRRQQQQKAADVGSRDSRPPLSSSHHWNTPSRTPSAANDRTETASQATAALSRTIDGRQRSTSRPPLSRGEASRASLSLPRHSSLDTGGGDMNRGDRLRASLRGNRRPGGETPNPERRQSSEKTETMRIKRSKSASNTSFRGIKLIA